MTSSLKRYGWSDGEIAATADEQLTIPSGSALGRATPDEMLLDMHEAIERFGGPRRVYDPTSVVMSFADLRIEGFASDAPLRVRRNGNEEAIARYAKFARMPSILRLMRDRGLRFRGALRALGLW